MISLIMLSLTINCIQHLLYFVISIKGLQIDISDYWVIQVQLIKIETFWSTIMILQYMSKDLGSFS